MGLLNITVVNKGVTDMLRGDYSNAAILASRFRQANSGQKTDVPGCVIGPSGIKRVKKYINRNKKAAQHKENHIRRAEQNSSARLLQHKKPTKGLK